MSLLVLALLGLCTGAVMLVFLRDDENPLHSLELLLSSLLWGATLAALFAPHGFVALLCALPGLALYVALRRRQRRRRATLLDVRLSGVRAAEAEALMERVRRGEGPAPGGPRDTA